MDHTLVHFELPADGVGHACSVALYRHMSWISSGPVTALTITPAGCPADVTIKEICFSSMAADDIDKKNAGKTQKRWKGL